MNSIQQVLLSVAAEKQKWKNEVLTATGKIHPVDLQELSDWFSEEIPYAAFRFDTTNLFFHPLPSGNYTLGRMIPRHTGGSKHASSLKPQAFHVHYFIFSPETLLHFANNPISLYQRIYAHRKLPFFRKHPPALEPIELSPQNQPAAPWVNEQALDCIAVNPGAKVAATLLQTVFDSVSTFFTGGPPTIRLIYSLFNLLPLSWRPELTFSTEFNFSHLRPFKVVGVSSGLDLYRLNSRDQSISFCDLAAMKRSEHESITLLDSWPLLIFNALLKKDYALLNRVYQKAAEQETWFQSEDSPPGTNPEELRVLANHFLKETLPPRLPRAMYLSPISSPTDRDKKGETDEKDKNITHIRNAHCDKINCHFVNCESSNSDDSNCEKAKDQKEPTVAETVFFTDDFFHTDIDEDPFEELFTSSACMESNAESEPFAMLKVAQVNHSTSHSLGRRLRKFPLIESRLKWLDACTARILLGDSTCVDLFRNSWKEVCGQVNPMQKLELTEDYLLVVRDFINHPAARGNGQTLIERDVNILELLDILLED